MEKPIVRSAFTYSTVLGVVCAAMALAALPSCRNSDESAGQHRNVIIITMDTTRADALGCYGNADAQTPHLDAFAAAGTLFEHCQTCTPQTLPAHTSIMTGLYPYVHGVRRNGVYRVDSAVQTLAETLKDNGYATAATVASFVLDRTFGLNQGFDTYHDVASTSTAQNRDRVERRGDEVSADAIALLEQMRSKPFFLWVHFFDPHFPYESRFHADQWSHEAYADEVAFLDGQIGHILDALDRLKLADNTLVIIVADHGEAFGEHGEIDHGYFLYETTVHVPLLMRGKGMVPAAQRVASTVRTIDLAPTILDLLNQPALPDAQGVSLRPLLEGNTVEPPVASYTESVEANAVFDMSRLRGYTRAGWKYVLAPPPELFNLPNDPQEEKNLASSAVDQTEVLRKDLWTLIADAPPVIRSDDEELDLSLSDAGKLSSIGYVGGAPEERDEDAVELDTFDPTGESPLSHAETITLYLSARRHMTEHQLAPAEKELQQVVVAVPTSSYPLRDLAQVLQGLGRTDEAADFYRRAIELKPTDLQTQLLLATLQFNAGKIDDALATLFGVREADPDNFTAHFLIGMAHLKQEKFDEAADSFKRALEIDPNSDQARAELERCEEALKP